jgi:RNA polymerase sigma factor for flagellar operon FliA
MQKATRKRSSAVDGGAILAKDALPLSMIAGRDAVPDAGLVAGLDLSLSNGMESGVENRVESNGGHQPFGNLDHPASSDALISGAAALQQPQKQMQEEEIAAHLSMVRFLARRIHERLPSHVELEELVGAGVLGLMDAYKKFNPEKKVKFRSYAQFRVRGAILDSLRTLDWSPRELRRRAREIEAAIQRLTGRVGRTPNEFEVAAEMKMTLPDYQHLLGDLKSLEMGTLNAERSEDSGEEELAYIPNRSEDDPLFQCLRGEMHGRLRDAIDRLPERERMVLNLYYFEELTMKEIGQILGVVESRISQVHASAVLHMRAAMQVFQR